MEKQRKEDEDREKNEQHGSRISRPVPTITNGSSSTSSSAMSKVSARLDGPFDYFFHVK